MSRKDHSARNPSISLSRQSILDATARCLGEVGFDGTNIRKIASTLGCAVGSIYRYFSDKRALLAAVCEQRFEPAAAAIESGGSVEQSARAYIHAALGSPESYRLMFWLASVGRKDATSEPILPEIVQRIIAGWAQRLSHEPTAASAWAALHGSIMLGRGADQIISELRRAIDGRPEVAGTIPTSIGSRPAAPRPVAAEQPDRAPAEVGLSLTEAEDDEEAVAIEARASTRGGDDVTML